MPIYYVQIWHPETKESKAIEIEQGDRTNLAYSSNIPEGWYFQFATEKKEHP